MSQTQSRTQQPVFQPEQGTHNVESVAQESKSVQEKCQAQVYQSPEEKADEARRIRRLQLMINMVMQVIQQDRRLPVETASGMVADARRAALAMFPEKALAFDLIYWPRLQRMMRERYRMQ
jgi:pyridoxal biosynthesis lyase PdxS